LPITSDLIPDLHTHSISILAKMVYVPALLLSLAASALAVTKNEPPALTYLFSANVTSGNATVVGQTPHGNRVVIPIVKGDVAGPKLNGRLD
jgi:hypothetical protein